MTILGGHQMRVGGGPIMGGMALCATVVPCGSIFDLGKKLFLVQIIQFREGNTEKKTPTIV